MMVFSQLLENLRSRLALTCLLILAFAGGLFLTIGTTSYAEHSDEKLTVFIDAYSKSSRYLVTSKPPHTFLTAYKDFPELTKTVADFRGQLEQDNGWELSSVTKRGFGILDYKGPDVLLNGYETGDTVRDIQYNDAMLPYCELKSLWVSQNFFDKFAVKTAVGKDFSDIESMQVSSLNTVYPIVMGWDYREFYAVGDIVTSYNQLYDSANGVLRQTRNLTRSFEVVGFLEPGAAIVANDSLNEEGSDSDLLYLDRYVICPMLRYDHYLPVDALEEKWVKSQSGIELASFILVTNRSLAEVQTAVEACGVKSGIDYATAGETMELTDLFRQEADQYFEVLKTTSWFIMIASVICLTVNLINKLISNLKKYSIHLISGGKLSDIRLYLVTEVLFIVLMSNLLAFTAALTFGGFVFSYSKTNIGGIMITVITPYSVLMAFVLSVVIIIVTLAIPLIKLERTEFDSLLRGRE